MLATIITIFLLGGGALTSLVIWASRQTRPRRLPRARADRPRAGLRLHVTVANRDPHDILLRADRAITIGRERDNLLVVDDPLVSRHHARLFFNGLHWMVQDEQSANGTFVNQSPVVRCTVLPGDTVQIGSARIQLLPAQGRAVRPPAASAERLDSAANTTGQQTFGLFTVVGYLGEGGISRVLLAQDMHKNRRLVALKVLHKQNQYLAEKFRQEGLLRLHHPHIARVYETGEIGGYPYIALEYIEGASLRRLLTGQPLSLDAALIVAGQVLLALDYAHRYNIIHRDIKPENIMISPRQGVKLIDFGIAKDLSALTRTHNVMLGTPHYMSYEQAMGRTVNATSDLYSAAIVLYEMLTAKVPFSAQEHFDVLWQHQRALPPPPRQFNPAIPLHVESAILRALAKDSAQRFQTAEEFHAALGCRRGQPVPAPLAGAAAALAPAALV